MFLINFKKGMFDFDKVCFAVTRFTLDLKPITLHTCFFAADLSHVAFCCRPITCCCFLLQTCHILLFFAADLSHVFFAADLSQACPAGCPARASRHHWPGKVPESYMSRVHVWSVLSLSDRMSLMAWALWALGLASEKDRLCFRLDQIPPLCDFGQYF